MLITSINNGKSRRACHVALSVTNPFRAVVLGGVRLEAFSKKLGWSVVDSGAAALHRLDGEMPKMGITPLMDGTARNSSKVAVQSVKQGYKTYPEFSKNGRSYVPGLYNHRRRGEG